MSREKAKQILESKACYKYLQKDPLWITEDIIVAMMEYALEQVKTLSSNPTVSGSFHGRDEEDAKVIAEAKRIWTEEHQGKLKAVKYMMENGWGLKVAHDYCRENFG